MPKYQYDNLQHNQQMKRFQQSRNTEVQQHTPNTSLPARGKSELGMYGAQTFDKQDSLKSLMKRQSAADLPAYGQILPNSHFSNRIMQNNSMNFDQKRVNNYTYQTSNKDHYKAQSLSQTSNPYTRRGRHDSNPTALKNIILMRNAMHRRQSNNHLDGSQNRNNNIDHYGVQQNRNQKKL